MRCLTSSVAGPDPGSGAILTPGPGKNFYRIPDPTLINESLVLIFLNKILKFFVNCLTSFSISVQSYKNYEKLKF
jgi:hypothetical protein